MVYKNKAMRKTPNKTCVRFRNGTFFGIHEPKQFGIAELRIRRNVYLSEFLVAFKVAEYILKSVSLRM